MLGWSPWTGKGAPSEQTKGGGPVRSRRRDLLRTSYFARALRFRFDGSK